MPLIICPKHGESGFTKRFSKKVVEVINSDLPIHDEQLGIFRIVAIDSDDDQELFTEEYLLLQQELTAMGVPDCVQTSSEDRYDFYLSLLPELSGICASCFKEYKNRHGTDMLGFN